MQVAQSYQLRKENEASAMSDSQGSNCKRSATNVSTQQHLEQHNFVVYLFLRRSLYSKTFGWCLQLFILSNLLKLGSAAPGVFSSGDGIEGGEEGLGETFDLLTFSDCLRCLNYYLVSVHVSTFQ